MISPSDWAAFALTLKLASVTTILLLALGLPLAWWMSQTQSKFKFVVEAGVSLPLVLPPTVLGFYLLIFLGANGPFAGWAGASGFAFSFTGLVIGSLVYSLPFVVQPLHNAFASVGQAPLEAATTLGASNGFRFWTIMIPLARRGILTAAVLGFAHTLGEFGVVLMIGGNIPGETQVLSIAIYDHVEAMEYAQAHLLSGGLLLFSLALLLSVYFVNRRVDGKAGLF